MTDDDMTRFVHHLADQVPDVDPPLTAVLAAAHEASGRRRRGRLLAGAVALAAAVALIAVLPAVVQARHDPHVPAAAGPIASDGTKLVGLGDVVIAVPAVWVQGDGTGCDRNTRAFYAQADSSLPFVCLEKVPTVSGLIVATSGIAKPGGPSCTSSTLCVQTWVREGTSFTATIVGPEADGRAQLAAMGASIHRLPAGYTTVPYWLAAEDDGEFRRSLGQAGLQAVDGHPDRYRDHLTEPAQGEVVAVGSTVTLGHADDVPSVPVGMKLVGTDGVAVAIPEGWVQQGQPTCSDPDHDYYDLHDPSYPMPGCAVTPSPNPPSHLDVSVGPGTSQPVVCDPQGCTATFVMGDVSFAVTTVGRDASSLMDRIAESQQALPDGWTTVPLWQSDDDFADTLDSAGLRAIQGQPDPADAHLTTPSQGAVVRNGSDVTLGAVPEPTTLVGADGVAMAVPSSWGFVQDAVCGSPHTPYYTVEERVELVFHCPLERSFPRPVSHLVIDDDLSQPHPAPAPLGASCDDLSCVQSWRVDDVQLTLTVTGPADDARATLARMGASIEHLPDDQVAVPPWTLAGSPNPTRVTPAGYAAAVRDSGLVPVLGVVDPDSIGVDSRQTEPAQGAVVATGSTVTVGAPGGTGEPVPPDPTAPDGMKLVGTKGVAIAVPDAWGPGQRPSPCGENPASDAYYLVVPQQDDASAPFCGAPPPTPFDGDLLVIGSATDTVGAQYGPPPDGDGVTCEGDHCTGQWTRADHDVRFVATMVGPGARSTLEAMGASVQALPDGWTTVPAWPVGWRALHPGTAWARIPADAYVDLIGGAGFVSSLSTKDDSHDQAHAVVDPAEGAVALVGSTVEISVP